MGRLKILYRKNLKMTPGKLAAQCVHAATGIRHHDYSMNVVVLGVSDRKYESEIAKHEHHELFRVVDAGHTELKPGTETCMAFYEEV